MAKNVLLLTSLIILYEFPTFAKSNSKTVFEFSRHLATCDFEDIDLHGTTNVIYAYGDETPSTELSVKRHDKRGSGILHLFDTSQGLECEKDDLFFLDLVTLNFTIPLKYEETYYHQQVFEIPSEEEFHYIGYKPVIEKGHEEYVHHMVVYECSDLDEDALNPENFGESFHTNTAADDCNGVTPNLAVWNTGGDGLMFPDNVGIPFGKNGIRYVLLETHYTLYYYVEEDNPKLLTDNSGLRLFLTTNLRENIAAMGVVGHVVESDGFVIPPNQEAFDVLAICSPQCLEDFMENDGLQELSVFAATPHTHYYGTSVSLKIIRDGVEVGHLVDEKKFDFEYQRAILFEEKKIRTGDSLVVTCTYNTEGHDQPVLGGFGTDDEMCAAWFFYYPALSENLLCGSDHYLEKWGPNIHDHGCTDTGFFEFLPFQHLIQEDQCTGNYSRHHPPEGFSSQPQILSSFDRSKYHTTKVLKENKFEVLWTVDGDEVHFAVVVDTKGWVGFGISPNGGMKNADVMIAWIDEEGFPHFHDRFVQDTEILQMPTVDEKQDFYSIFGGFVDFDISKVDTKQCGTKLELVFPAKSLRTACACNLFVCTALLLIHLI